MPGVSKLLLVAQFPVLRVVDKDFSALHQRSLHPQHFGAWVAAVSLKEIHAFDE
jgi:hypothetical protein